MSYNNTKTVIQFGDERMEIEGSPSDVKALVEIFFQKVLDLQKMKSEMVTLTTLPPKPETVFK